MDCAVILNTVFDWAVWTVLSYWTLYCTELCGLCCLTEHCFLLSLVDCAVLLNTVLYWAMWTMLSYWTLYCTEPCGLCCLTEHCIVLVTVHYVISPQAHLHVVGMLRFVSKTYVPTELAHSFLFCSCVYFCLCDPFNCIYSINSPNNFLFSHSVLPVLPLPCWFFQLYISFWKKVLLSWYNS